MNNFGDGGTLAHSDSEFFVISCVYCTYVCTCKCVFVCMCSCHCVYMHMSICCCV